MTELAVGNDNCGLRDEDGLVARNFDGGQGGFDFAFCLFEIGSAIALFACTTFKASSPDADFAKRDNINSSRLVRSMIDAGIASRGLESSVALPRPSLAQRDNIRCTALAIIEAPDLRAKTVTDAFEDARRRQNVRMEIPRIGSKLTGDELRFGVFSAARFL